MQANRISEGMVMDLINVSTQNYISFSSKNVLYLSDKSINLYY